MFSCSACFRRAITVLLRHLPSEPILAKPRAGPRDLSRNYARAPKRHHSTVESLHQGHHLRVLRKTLKQNSRIPLKLKAVRRGPSAVTRRNANARERNKAVYLSDDPAPDQAAAGELYPAKERYQAQFLTDPLKLAKTVLQRLRISDVPGAMALVRASDREMVENVVSWNHIMDFEMSFQNVKQALKVYNEMKKRGHKPDAHTYTIMLRGFAANVKTPQAVQNALGVYNSMFAPNSAVTPNIIHTNAVINVCARGRDMDGLWSVAGRLPETGPGAPDKWTFTTILNALARNAQKRASELGPSMADSEEQVSKLFDEAVADGRKLWGDVIERWRKGDLMVDEPLVCAMGRLLLLGSRRSEWEDVFGLVEQTMRIPKWRHASAEQATLPSPESDFQPMNVQFPDADGSGKAGVGRRGNADAETGTGTVGAPNRSIYAQPGNNALSMLVHAALMTKSLPAGKMYWDLLTDANGPYRLVPDAANLAGYLRLLRVSRSSKAVVDLLRNELFTQNESLAMEFYKRGTFVIAMSTCVRDKNNVNVFEHAGRVLDMMQERLEPMDSKVMTMYLNLAILTTPGVGSASPWKDMEFEKDGARNPAMRALKRLGPDVVNVRQMMKTRVLEAQFPDRPKRSWEKEEEKKREEAPSVDDLATFLQTMIGAYDRLLSKGAEAGVERSLLEEWLKQKQKLGSFVTKMVGGVRPTRRSTGTGDEAGGQEADMEPGEVVGLRKKRWEMNPASSPRRTQLTKQQQGPEKWTRDFPAASKFKLHNRMDDNPPRKTYDEKEWNREKRWREDERRHQFKHEYPSMAEAQKQEQLRRQVQMQEEGVVVKGWGSAFGEMEKDQQEGARKAGEVTL